MLNVQKFCERLTQARKAACMTTLDVAAFLNTDAAVITRYENAVRCPNIARVVELAELYGVSIGWLCGMDGGNTDEG